MNRLNLLVTGALCALFAASSAFGAYTLVDTDPSESTAVEPSTRALFDGQDIREVYTDEDSTNYYFRFDVQATPDTNTASDNSYAGLYGIYIDSVDGQGGDASDIGYIPYGLTGIDVILDLHISDTGALVVQQDDLHIWNDSTGTFDRTNGSNTWDNATTFEYQVAKTTLSGSFDFWAATHDEGVADPTFDIAGSYVPEPATMSLLGLAGVALLRKRRS